ncbi:MAG: hypothetical protein HKN21_11140 [Candidatus Eisenbacteria bacterium]|uniref:Uncharacterized protein n=1 Tax=Eiseniibacteriota bacterium TaxID=2212470 RepID=A0A7Y2EC82_UNCEI|nr:hypothetical protein [Candidatus Eisenbacteria bacterium]
MFEKLFSSPIAAGAFLLVLLYAIGIYYTQKERAKVKQKRGGRKTFSPQWTRGKDGRRRRRPHRRSSGGFKPQWNRDRPRSADSKDGASSDTEIERNDA